MGKLARAFGLGEKGKIGILVEKPSYIAGEVVRGTIYVEIYEPIECDALVLKATGKERVQWREVRNERDGSGNTITKYADHSDAVQFFKQNLVICAIPQVYTPGRYSYQFKYELPLKLPGVFHLESFSSGYVDELKAKIQYKFRATLEVGGFFTSDLKADCNLVVHERNLMGLRPSEDSITQRVNFCCCFNKGTCDLAVAMDRGVYLPGETAHIQCHVHNNSSVDITAMKCILYQDIGLRLSHGGFVEFTREVASRAFPGVQAQSSCSQAQALPLAATDHHTSLNPSTTGTLIQCSYRINVECDIPWCPDVLLHLPVTLIAPEIPSGGSWEPDVTDGFAGQQAV